MSERNELDMATSSTNPVNHIMNLMRRRPVPKKQAMVSVSVGITDNIGNVPMDDAIRRRIIERSVVRMNDMVEEADTSEPDIVQPIIKNIKKKGVGKIPKKAVEVNAEPLVDNENREPHDDNSTQPAQPAQPTQPIARTTPRPQTLPIREGPVSQIQLTDNQFTDHFPNRDTTNHTRLKGSQYYLTDRENFISFINTLFEPYKKQLAELESSSQLSCDRMGDAGKDFSLLFHQEVVKEYINLHTPYRGVLLYHGLGSGKTCSSIAITEGLKSTKPVIIMTPAALRKNYVEELKTCGDVLYRKNQFWEFVGVDKTAPDDVLLSQMSHMIGLTREQILKQGGSWMVNIKKKSNHDTMSVEDKTQLEEQIDMMIHNKYQFINYNGLRQANISNLSNGYKTNPFDDAVVVVDEAHNLVGRIVNKLGRKKNTDSSVVTDDTPMAIALYEYLMTAKNARIVLLSGTPMINYPNELAVLFNILRGKMTTWSIRLKPPTNGNKFDEKALRVILAKELEVDYMEYSATTQTMKITRNPYGFKNRSTTGSQYSGVVRSKKRRITRKKGRPEETRVDVEVASNKDFISGVVATLRGAGVGIESSDISNEDFKSLPDTMDAFQAKFIEPTTYDIKNEQLLQRRIMGLTSYFRSAQEELMPRYERGRDFHLVKCAMSDFQFTAYEEARANERKLDTNNAKKQRNAAGAGGDIYADTVSTYRIFSRAFCNFVFPRPEIDRPMPSQRDDAESETTRPLITEDMVDGVSVDEQIADGANGLSVEDEDEVHQNNHELVDGDYKVRVQRTMEELESRSGEFLTREGLAIYSPKFLNILENIEDPSHKGLHMLYSQFRTMEGIGVMRLVLKQNGFAEFKLIHGDANQWTIETNPGDEGKPTFALYTGTETTEEKELLRNIYNGNWEALPDGLREEVDARGKSNMYGEVIKLFIISASGAEGISLKNTRYVHIMEPYWHPVRVQQVIGRARRICSHSGLPEEEQTVEVFCYVAVLSEAQLKSDKANILRKKDLSKIDGTTPVTTDELLFDISSIKERLANELLKNAKESAFDCAIHASTNKKEGLKCLSFGRANTNTFASKPDFTTEDGDEVTKRNKKRVTVNAVEMRIAGVPYAKDTRSDDLYDYEQYLVGQQEFVGRLVRAGNGYRIER
jgi:hypothetical protein